MGVADETMSLYICTGCSEREMAAMLRGSESRAQATKEHEYIPIYNVEYNSKLTILLAPPTQFTQLRMRKPAPL